MPVWLKWGLDWLWGKVVPMVTNFVKNWIKGKKIDSETDKEEDEVDRVKKKIDEWRAANPEAEVIPQDLEDQLRDATAHRNNGLSDGF